MRRLLGVMAVAALVAGCGGDDGDGQAQTIEETSTTSTSDETTTSQAEESSSADLEGVVVQLSDLPPGWTVNPAGEDEGDDDFCTEESPEAPSDPEAEAESSFMQSEMGPFLTSGASRYGSSDEAEEAFDFFADEFSKCDGYTETDEDGAETTYSLSALSFPEVGDDTFAARMSATTTFGPINFDVVVERSDDVMLVILNGGFGSPDTALTEELLLAMDGRL